MIIESNIRKVLEGLRRLQTMVQESPRVGSLDKVKSQVILREAEEALKTFTEGTPGKEKSLTVEASTIEENINAITSVSYDVHRAFNILGSLPISRYTDIQFIRKRDDGNIIENKFTLKRGHIRAEYGNSRELMYIIQYEDGSYNVTSEKNINII